MSGGARELAPTLRERGQMGRKAVADACDDERKPGISGPSKFDIGSLGFNPANPEPAVAVARFRGEGEDLLPHGDALKIDLHRDTEEEVLGMKGLANAEPGPVTADGGTALEQLDVWRVEFACSDRVDGSGRDDGSALCSGL